MTTIAVSSPAPDPSNVRQYEEYISKSLLPLCIFVSQLIMYTINMSAHRVIKSEIDWYFSFDCFYKWGMNVITV